MFDIRKDDLTGAQTRALLALHLAGMRDNSPAESVHALDLSGLKGENVTVWTLWSGPDLLGVGALRVLSPAQGEIKSMRTHPDHLRKGVASALLVHIMDEARARGMRHLSLETGTGPAFENATRLYRQHEFEDGPAFGDYRATSFNRFLHRPL